MEDIRMAGNLETVARRLRNYIFRQFGFIAQTRIYLDRAFSAMPLIGYSSII